MSRRFLLAFGFSTIAILNSARSAEPVQVKIETSVGDFVIQLDEVRSPLTVPNFLQYVNDGFYNGTIFHRVVNGFVIQGGGYTADMTTKPPRQPLVNESGNGLSNRRGSVAMARTGEPHSADAQFYVNLADNVALDPKPTRWGYAVFGDVIQGMEVVDEIGHRPTGSNAGMQDVPLEPVVIRKVTVLKSPVAR
ncbi:MAG: peptidylprolyl isomerase [Gammaproteobacteria bacterium]